MKIYILILVLIILVSNRFSYGQDNHKPILYNTISGGLVAGIGSIVNKDKNDQILPTFVKGFCKGVLGGTLVYSSKYLVYHYSNTSNWGYLWGSKVINSVGNSMIENGATNIGLFERLNLTYGFNYLEFHTKGSFRLKYKVMPMALYGFLYFSAISDFNLSESLMFGHPIFETSVLEEGKGAANTTSILMNNTVKDQDLTLAHEIIHTYLHLEFMRINKFFERPKQNWLNHENRTISFLNKWVYLDISHFVYMEFYRLSSLQSHYYYDNIFEKEADRYSRRDSF